MLMGFFQGTRNIFQHNQIESGASNVLTIIFQASFFVDLLNGHSITKKGKWIPTRIDYSNIYLNMSNPLDKLRLKFELRMRNIKRNKMNYL